MQTFFMTRPRWVTLLAIIAVLFGALTLYSGGSVLFGDRLGLGGAARAAAGDYVPFVLWFNFLAGFGYILTGIGLFLWRDWAVNLAMGIAIATLVVFAGFGLHIWLDGTYEPRIIKAMILRSAVWLVIAFTTRAAWKAQLKRHV